MSASYLLKRLVYIALTLVVVSSIVFFATQILPGDAAQMMLGEHATPQALQALRTSLGLDEPLWQQYGHWVGRLLQGDLGTSLRTHLPVSQMMLPALQRSLLLTVCALALTLLLAIPIGAATAIWRGGVFDVTVSIGSYLGVSLPEFVTATLAVVFLANPALGWFPATGYVAFSESVGGALRSLALPVITVSIILVAHVSRMVRSELVDVLHTDYIRAARMKGLSSRHILWRHALPNALLPAITIVALDVGYLMGGIIVVEEIFAFPGIGRELIVAIQARDLPAIQAGALIMAMTYALANFAADLLYAALDKRIQYA